MLPASVRARERGLVSLWQWQSRRKWLDCSRGDTSCSRGKGTGRASAGAASLGRRGEKVEVRTRTQRSRKGSAGWLRPACKITLGRTEAALLLINSAQHLLGSSEAWTREWMDGVLDSGDLSHCRDET